MQASPSRIAMDRAFFAKSGALPTATLAGGREAAGVWRGKRAHCKSRRGLQVEGQSYIVTAGAPQTGGHGPTRHLHDMVDGVRAYCASARSSQARPALASLPFPPPLHGHGDALGSWVCVCTVPLSCTISPLQAARCTLNARRLRPLRAAACETHVFPSSRPGQPQQRTSSSEHTPGHADYTLKNGTVPAGVTLRLKIVSLNWAARL